MRPIFEALASGVSGGGVDVDNAAYDELRAILAEYSRARASGIYAVGDGVCHLRDAVLGTIHDASTLDYADTAVFSKLVDGLGLITFEAFALARETVIINQNERLLELSTPVIKLWDGILAVPLVGTLDSARTQVAQHLVKTAVAARLMARSASSPESGHKSRRRSSTSGLISGTCRPKRIWREPSSSRLPARP